LIVGNGTRQKSDKDLMGTLQNLEALKGAKIVEHTGGSNSLTNLGTTSFGSQVEISSFFSSADIRIVVGETIIDHFTGFRGSFSTVLPQISRLETIEHNRSLSFQGDSAPGVIEGNLCFQDAIEAATMAKIDFSVNLVNNSYGELLAVFTGELVETLDMALKVFGKSHIVKCDADSDIIVTSAGGSRFDFDLYHSVWALNGVSDIAKKGATIILIAECSEGLGAPGLESLAQVDQLSELKRRYALGGRAVHIIKSLLRSNEVILVSALPGYFAESLGLSVFRTANEALYSVFSKKRGKKTLIVTHGCSTVPTYD